MERKHLPADEMMAMEQRSVLPPADAADQPTTGETPEVLPVPGAEESTDAPQHKRPLPERIAERLGETRPGPHAQIMRMLSLWGPERVKALTDEALALYQGEGMLIESGQRKRTAGGIFFYLAYQRASREEWQRIHPQAFVPKSQRGKPRKPKPAEAQPAAQPKPPVQAPAPIQMLTLEEIIEFALTLKEGIAMTTTMKLIGRPGQIKTAGKCVLFTLKSEKVPALPAGMPPVEAGTKYLVIVAAKQWNKIAPGLEADAEAKFLIEGYPTHEKDFIAVEALNCKLLSKQTAAPQPHEHEPTTT
jgi:hypothetical protein